MQGCPTVGGAAPPGRRREAAQVSPGGRHARAVLLGQAARGGEWLRLCLCSTRLHTAVRGKPAACVGAHF